MKSVWNMKRRTWLQTVASTALAGCGGGSSSSDAGGENVSAGPNILMISIDDLNDWVGFLGNTQAKTPSLDALAARSTVFERAYCTAPVCSASRAGVLSGLSVQSTGVHDLEHTFKSVNPGKRQFDEMLSTQGYVVVRHGKVDHIGTEKLPVPTPTVLPYANKLCASPEMKEGSFDWGPIPMGEEQMPDYIFAQKGIDFLKNYSGKKPFCLSVGFFRPHVAWYVPQRFFDMYPLDKIVLPEAPTDDLNDLGPAGRETALKWNFHNCLISQNLWADAVQAYLACITWADTQVGRLLSALEASRHADKTVVVLWSDHGFHLGEKFHWHKMALWEHATRVPCLIRTPGQVTGQRVTSCISLRDLAPTLLELAQAQSDYAMDGRSLSTLLKNPATPWDHPVLITKDVHDHAVRSNQWRYIRYASGERELYDVVSDPGEYRNLAGFAEYEAIMADLDAYMPLMPPA